MFLFLLVDENVVDKCMKVGENGKYIIVVEFEWVYNWGYWYYIEEILVEYW